MADAEAVQGRLIAAGGRAFVLALPLPTSLPIPLAVIAPAGVALATWAFAGLGTDRNYGSDRFSDPPPHPEVPERSGGLEGGLQQPVRPLEPSFEAAGAAPQDEGAGESSTDRRSPRVLLLLAARDEGAEAFLRGGQGTLTLATHYRDVRVTFPGCAPIDALAEDGRRALTRAVLADASAVLAQLGALPEFDASTERQPPAADAPQIAFPRPGEAVLAGAHIPDHLLLRAGAARWLARVASAKLRFAPESSVALTLDEPGRATDAGPETALALSGEGVLPLRVGTA